MVGVFRTRSPDGSDWQSEKLGLLSNLPLSCRNHRIFEKGTLSQLMSQKRYHSHIFHFTGVEFLFDSNEGATQRTQRLKQKEGMPDF